MQATTSPRILILDDEAEMRALLQRYLHSQGFQVQLAQDAKQLNTLLARQGFDVLVLDINLPGEDGLAICRRLRSSGETTPVLMLTARGDPLDRIIGLEMGADDYLGKPFEPRELAARLHAMVRRAAMSANGRERAKEQQLTFGRFVLDFAARRLLKDGQEIELTSGEFALLHSLACNPNRSLGRERLIEMVQGQAAARQDAVTVRSIDVQIMRLRRMLEKDPAHPRLIQTVWGKGYMFVPAGEI